MAAQHYLMSRDHHFEDVVGGGESSPSAGADGGQGGQSECDAKFDSAGVRTQQHGAARNDRTRCHHSGCSGFFETCVSYRNWPAARGRVKNSRQGPWMALPA